MSLTNGGADIWVLGIIVISCDYAGDQLIIYWYNKLCKSNMWFKV